MALPHGFNLSDPDSFAHGHPHAAYDAIRSTAPVCRHEASATQPAFWLLTRHEDIRTVSMDKTRFTSTEGFRVPTDTRAAMDPTIGAVLRRFMLAMDEPEHGDFRQLVASAFLPSGIAAAEPMIRANVAKLIDGLKERDTAEFVSDIGAKVPIQTVCAVMGVPPEDEWRVFEFTNAVFGTDDPDYAPSLEVANERYLAIFDYGWTLLEERRRNPREDLLTRIANGTVGGRPLDEIEQKSFFSNMISAGNETTRSSFAGALWALSLFPDERRRLVDDPSLIPAAVNELLRWFSPVFQMARTALEDVQIGSETIRKGEKVAMLYGAGNHDPAMFEDPHRLDLARANANRHITFGFGIHHCIGNRLAQMQLAIILEAFLKAFPDYEILEEPRYVRSNFVGAMKSLPMRLRG
ncbi:MAG TPA: cytochrome P450 [Chakrabartia sp.]|nr:cytochrome P450 [Chakrabartia sp.]